MSIRFDDRWTYDNPALAAVPLTSLTDQQLANLSPDFVRYATQVRGHSILTRQKTLVEIYRIATLESDPRIALYLAAAKDKKGRRMFPTMEAVKAAMFGPTSSSSSSFLDPERNIFVQGIWRVSAALTAARLIGQLSQIEEQANHAIWLEKQALRDLEELLRVVDAEEFTSEQKVEVREFVFEVTEMVLIRPLHIRLFMPSQNLSHWTDVATLTGQVSTARICSLIADAINQRCLASSDGNVLAAPILAGGSGLHRIELTARRRDLIVAAEAITVAFDYGDYVLPFRWGVRSDELSTMPVNSALLLVQQGRVSALSQNPDDQNYQPTVLYFRPAPADDNGTPLDDNGQPITQWATVPLTFRVSPTMDTAKSVSVPLGSDRPSLVATTLLNELHALKDAVKALGALFRNDPSSANGALTALELVAWTLTNPEAWIVLDLLEIPPDVEVAVGNLQGPFTDFSRKPRSIRVQAVLHKDASTHDSLINLEGSLPRIIRQPESQVVRRIKDKLQIMNPHWR